MEIMRKKKFNNHKRVFLSMIFIRMVIKLRLYYNTLNPKSPSKITNMNWNTRVIPTGRFFFRTVQLCKLQKKKKSEK